MAQGFGSMIDDIKNRDNDDPVGMKSKKKGKSEETTKSKRSGGFDGIIDSIQDRDNDDPTGTNSKKKDKSEDKPENKRGGGGGIDGILDNIRDRDDDDPTGNKPKKKSAKKDDSEGDEKNPLDGIAKTTTQIVGAGMGAMLGIGVMKGMSGLMNMDK